MAINNHASHDARYARTGKDAAIYDGDGNMFASVDDFESKVTYNNAKYTPLGDPQEHETADSYSITITFSELIVRDIEIFQQLVDAMNSGITPEMVFQGTLTSRDGDSQERITYTEVIPSGDIDLQNFKNGDVIKRSWSLFVNGKPQLVSTLDL